MFWCKVKNFLSRFHTQKCDICMSQLASREEVKALIIQERDVEDFHNLWPAIRTGVSEEKPAKKAMYPINRKWAFAAAGVVSVFLAGYLLLPSLFQNGALLDRDGDVRFQIISIRVGDEPATPFLYQPKDSDMILVWAEKGM